MPHPWLAHLPQIPGYDLIWLGVDELTEEEIMEELGWTDSVGELREILAYGISIMHVLPGEIWHGTYRFHPVFVQKIMAHMAAKKAAKSRAGGGDGGGKGDKGNKKGDD